MQATQQFSTWFSKQKLFGKLAIGCGGLLILLCLCSIPVAIFSPSTPTSANPDVSSLQTEAVQTAMAGINQTAVANMPTNTLESTNTPAPTDTATLQPAGESRDNPVPAGTSVNLGDMTLTIVNATRPADNIVSNGNMFNSKPEANQEYVQVDVQVVCNKSSSDKCYFAESEIKAVGIDGNIHETEMVAGIDGLIESGEFFGGATRSGKMFFIVPKDDKSVVLFYDPMFLGDTIYLALP